MGVYRETSISEFFDPFQSAFFQSAARRNVDRDWLSEPTLFANFTHITYLKTDGSIILVEPNESSQSLYANKMLRESTRIDVTSDHEFHVSFDEQNLRIEMNDFNRSFDIAEVPKVLGRD